MATSNSSRTIRPSIHPAIKALIPSHPAAYEALALATSLLPQPILNHSLRTYLYAHQNLYSKHDPTTQDPFLGLSPVHVPFGAALRLPPHALFVAAILHDIGPTCAFDHAPGRFEVVGADEAVRILSAHDDDDDDDVDEAALRAAWLAAALHAVPHVPERMGGCTAAFRLAIRRDFGSTSWEGRPSGQFGDLDSLGLAEEDTGAQHAGEAFLAAGGRLEMDVETLWPRLDVEKVLGDEVVRQAMVNAAKAPRASWPGDLVRAKKEEPQWEGVNKGF